jgi:hypothetical protein
MAQQYVISVIVDHRFVPANEGQCCREMNEYLEKEGIDQIFRDFVSER